MTERLQHPGSRIRSADRPPLPPLRAPGSRTGRPAPRRSPEGTNAVREPTILGFPAEEGDEEVTADDLASVSGLPAVVRAGKRPAGTIDPAHRLMVLRRRDRVAGLALVWAGMAATASLGLHWLDRDGTTGLALVRQGVELALSGLGALVDSDLWPPTAVVACGALLLLLGGLMFVPAHAHRVLGVLALLVASAAAAALVVLLAEVGWRVDRLGLGTWFGVAVCALGLLGAFKAMLTAPRVSLRDR